MPEITAEDIQRAVATELQKHGGDSGRTLRAVISRNAKHRETIRQLTAEVDTLKQGKPADGAVVLSSDEATRWAAYEAIGRKPEEIVTALTQGEEAVTTLANIGKKEAARDAAVTAGFDPDAFLALPGALDLTYEVRTEKEEGEDVKRAYVKVGGETKKLDMGFVETRADWKALKGALEADASPAQEDRNAGPRYTPDRVEKGSKGKRVSDEDVLASVTSTMPMTI